ncbi:four helix bundle protein [Patescibacteria group bacterium]|nr:four helix bundle protein [Patescibacteria group bacterium]MBU4512130.1 four helix bundle protein [Patescibacteria group bacterium]MCG2692513.1 four helix bundle protein [Candidatus Parcubacteria bacterium]
MSYISLDNLKVYQLSRGYSREAWSVYEILNWQMKKVIGDQFIKSADSVGANIAEGYGRFHYLDKVRFYYNARGSLLESRHWLELLKERKLITQEKYNSMLEIYKNLTPGLNGLISSTRKNN